MGRCDTQCFDCADALGALGQACDGVGTSLAVTQASVIEEFLWYCVLQRAHVLPSEPVVAHPLLVVVVLGPGDVPDVTHVDVHPREGHFSHHAPAADGVGHSMEQAVAQAGVFDDLGLVLG